MAASKKPPGAPDEPTEKEGRALSSPSEKSAGRGRRLAQEPSGKHHLVAEVTGAGPALGAQEAAAAPKKHAVPAEVTAGRGLALALTSSEEVTARGAAVKEPPPSVSAGRRAQALAEATAAASRAPGRKADTQDDTRDLSPSPRGERAGQRGVAPPKADARAGRGTEDAADDEGAANAAPEGHEAPPEGEDDFDAAAEAEEEGEGEGDSEGDSEGEDDEDGLEDEDLPGAPPGPDDAAARVLAVAALLQRALHEARPTNVSEVRQLQGWVDAFGLYASFGPGAFELFDAPHGSWAPEDRAAVGWMAEELRLLLWALGVEPALPSTFERSEARPLLKKVPLLEPPQVFLEKAALRALDELEVMRAFYEVVLEALRCEVWARAVLLEPASLEDGDEELEELLASAAESEGVDLPALEKKSGKPAAAAAGLRVWGKQLVTSLFESGSPHAPLAFDSGALEAMGEAALANAYAIVRQRAAALEWLTEGDEWDFDEEADSNEGDEAAEEEDSEVPQGANRST
ncbi:MAG: hypothetical protein AMXMBFR34_08220 [Myxococcaceae bacterium]